MGWPFATVYLSLVIGAIYFTFVTVPNALNSNHWPQVQGQVINGELIQRKRTTKNGNVISVFSAKIYFQYSVGNNEYSAYHVKWADHNSGDNIQKAMMEQYPANTKVTVFYNPKKPSAAVLQPGLSFAHIVTGLFLLISIALMAFVLYRNARNRR